MRERVDDMRCWMRRGRVTGTFLKLPSTAVVDMAAEAFDFAVVDREHSRLTEGEALAMLAHAHAIGFPAMLRLPSLDPAAANRALEAGAAGIQLSQVGSAAEVERLRAACEYAPAGSRSISLGHALAGYGRVPMDEYVAASAGRPLVIAQIESIAAARKAGEILAAGPDVAFVGMADLTVDAGFDRKEVGALVGEVRSAAEASGVVLGGINLEDDPSVRYSMVSSDVDLLQRAMLAAGGQADGVDTSEEGGVG